MLAKSSNSRRLAYVIAICLWAIVCFFGSQFFVVTILQGLLELKLLSSKFVISNIGDVTIGAIIYLVMLAMLIGLPLVMMHRRTTLKDLGLGRLIVWRDYLLAAGGLVVYFALAMVVMNLAKFLPWVDLAQKQEVGIVDPSNGELILVFLLFAVVAPIVEEVIFRGFLFHHIRKSMPFWLTAIIVSVLFGAAHMQWNVGINVFVMSLVMCWAREYSGTIWPGIVMHMLKNAIAVYALFVVQL